MNQDSKQSEQELETLVATEVETAMARYAVNHDLAKNIIAVATKNIKQAILTHLEAAKQEGFDIGYRAAGGTITPLKYEEPTHGE